MGTEVFPTEQIIPSYYEKFQCLASACPESCCRLWEIEADPALQALYQSISGDLGKRLRAALTTCPDGSVILTNIHGACALLDDDGLCAAQKALGQKGIGRVCREFPRMTQDYGTFAELDLELSCPEATRLILTAPSAVPVIRQVPGGEEPDYDPALMELLQSSRCYGLALVSDPKFTIGEALAALLLYACEIQARIDGAEAMPFSPEAAVKTARSLAKQSDVGQLLDFYGSLELLTDDWQEYLKSPRSQPVWFPELRAFARYELNRYWLHAVSDFDLVPRIKMVIAAVIALSVLHDSHRESQFRAVTLYSKEIDDDPTNIEAILDAAYTVPAFTDDRLLGHLLL